MDVKVQGDYLDTKGIIDMHWRDPYDWKQGDGFQILPKHLHLADTNALFLEKYGKAKSYNMSSNWQLKFEGKYYPESQKWEEVKWK